MNYHSYSWDYHPDKSYIKTPTLFFFLAQRERQEFERILREQQRDIEKEKAERIAKGAELGQHANLLRRQIQERERHRIEERKQFFAESENLTSEQEDHEKKIQKVMTHF